VRKTWIACCSERKNISGENAMGLQNQLPGQDVTRQIAVKIKDPGSIGNDPPEDRDKQNVFNPWKEKTKQFHKEMYFLGYPAP
jgi:hypothetical protein